MLKILEHSSTSYAPRTYANAASADVTIALAVDYSTAGEKLTKKAAGDKYIALPLEDVWISQGRRLYRYMKFNNCKTINVAGNGIYTLVKHGWTQESINEYVFQILDNIHRYIGIDKIVSGGQTGVDLAGGVAGYRLGIDTTMLLPKGFKQRHEDGVDVDHTHDEIMKQILEG